MPEQATVEPVLHYAHYFVSEAEDIPANLEQLMNEHYRAYTGFLRMPMAKARAQTEQDFRSYLEARLVNFDEGRLLPTGRVLANGEPETIEAPFEIG